jgi:DNA mismatch repair protein MutL
MFDLRKSIEILPPLVVEKIAAGEVIERPASVLKELVENAIDSGASEVHAVIENAGFSLISVVDNGSGMSAEDLGKSLLAHSTSKIRSEDDLFAIATMGFRGEALASIAAVSRLCMATSATFDGLGYAIIANGGERGEVKPVSHTRGTTVEVRDLFFNVPARKKFMKSARGEQTAVVRVVEQLAVPFPAIHFTLTVDGKKVLDFPVADSLVDRIATLAGADFARSLIPCENTRPGLDVTVFISSPQNLTARPRYQSLYVNLRRVDNDAVTFSIREAFSQFLSAQFRPSFFCFLSVDPSSIDVNVHPTKQQVKFEDERALSGFIFSSVKKGIAGRQVGLAEVFAANEKTIATDKNPEVAPPLQEKLAFPVTGPRTADPFASSFNAPSVSSEGMPGPTGAKDNSPEIDKNESATDFPSGGAGQTIIPFPGAYGGHEISAGKKADPGAPLTKERDELNLSWDLISCYQIHEMYIMAPIKNGIVLIDQHAAHERVLYEQALEDSARGRSSSQQLLFPVVIELSPLEKDVVIAGLGFFTAFGFEAGDFGGNTISVSAIPFFMKTGDVEETVRSMVRYLLDEKERDAIRETEKRFAAAFACGAAIKAGQKLSQEEMNALVNSLFATKNPYICPHGRPTLVRISLDELSRRFLR